MEAKILTIVLSACLFRFFLYLGERRLRKELREAEAEAERFKIQADYWAAETRLWVGRYSRASRRVVDVDQQAAGGVRS